jgi:hypothetical protein
MSLTLEDGSGVAGAVSFVQASFADTFHAARGNTAWTGTEAVKEAALVRAFDYLSNEKRYRYRGTRSTTTQVAPFPRTGCTELGGSAEYAANDIPWRMKHAQCVAALAALSGELESALGRGGAITSESVGPISVSYAADAPRDTVYTGVDGLLEPLLWGSYAWRDSTPYMTDPEVEEEFTSGTYDNTGRVL